MAHYRMFINGSFLDSDDRYELLHPATGAAVSTVAKGDESHVDRAVEAADHAFRTSGWRDTTPDERADLILRVRDILVPQTDELARLAVQENGMALRIAEAVCVGMPVAQLELFAALARGFQRDREVEVTGGYKGIIRREPFGVVAGIVPWNTPLVLAVWKAIPALAAGNSVVLKVDEKTPSAALRLAEALQQAGLPDGMFNIVFGDGDTVGSRLTAHPRVRKVSFTGSTATGREILRNASAVIKPITLELGGKGANIVLEDADVPKAVDGALWAFLVNGGAACESGTRLLLPESLHDEFVARMVERMRTLKVGDPGDRATDLGPVINARHRDRVQGYIEIAEKEGATIAYGGALTGPEYETGYWIHPTLLTDVTSDMRVAAEEIFGPVLSVLTYSTVDEAIEIANDTEYGLSAGVWTSDQAKGLEVAGRLEGGTVWVNDWHVLTGEMPFGGFKQSGVGRELGPSAVEAYTQEKSIIQDYDQPLAAKPYAVVLSTPPGQT